ncbi:carboxymuconolactone decarboxylase family protein [Nakamurella endophytica]|uniref:Carboxymuconolactone decarboxylase-like domain-containing protein n=1 Tax=Nakamurella endophytica TaxID=1748367 RepID=A0A917WKM9_9ACTN|nr:carboxymuconolactone decarboxylase family protein [Nakamurella endophytica]GGM11197.1 hypothetical protein GCM10011594_33970 [Nakamurella endophytica]
MTLHTDRRSPATAAAASTDRLAAGPRALADRRSDPAVSDPAVSDPAVSDPAVSVPALAAPVDAAERRSRARVPLDEPAGLFGRVLRWWAVRQYGQMPDNALALAHHRPALVAIGLFERRVARWNRLDPQLRALAEMATAVRVGCSWCVDFGWFVAHGHGLDLAKIGAVPAWRDSDLFSPVERQVLEFAEALTATPAEVTDELAASLRAALGDAALVELAMMVAVENERSRFNAGLGLASQGFSESCRVPGARP